jgi:hypothetical protein
MAHHMAMDEAKVDPVTRLPPEVLNIIFSCLDLSSLLYVASGSPYACVKVP